MPVPHPNLLITGGAKRLGAIIAKHMAAKGWHIVLHYNSSQSEAQQVVADIIASGGAASCLSADLRQLSSLPALIEQARTLAGPISGLINSASLFDYDTAKEFTLETLQLHMEVNLSAPLILSRLFAAQLPTHADGVIVNLLDQKLTNLNPDFYTYTVSKFGLAGATKMMAQAYAPNIRVCGVAPGLCLPSGDQTEQEFNAVAGKYNLRQRPISPENIAKTVAFIFENEALTGEIIHVDNGQHLVSSNNDIMFNTRNKK
ncbi:MAG: SDR family oxidoreductase [bacterium]